MEYCGANLISIAVPGFFLMSYIENANSSFLRQYLPIQLKYQSIFPYFLRYLNVF